MCANLVISGGSNTLIETRILSFMLDINVKFYLCWNEPLIPTEGTGPRPGASFHGCKKKPQKQTQHQNVNKYYLLKILHVVNLETKTCFPLLTTQTEVDHSD